ncbi:hypothetical protein ACFGVS_08740 [Mucilaginibacter sp. AW1-7]
MQIDIVAGVMESWDVCAHTLKSACKYSRRIDPEYDLFYTHEYL